MTSLWISCILPKNNSLRISAGKKNMTKKREREKKKEFPKNNSLQISAVKKTM